MHLFLPQSILRHYTNSSESAQVGYEEGPTLQVMWREVHNRVHHVRLQDRFVAGEVPIASCLSVDNSRRYLGARKEKEAPDKHKLMLNSITSVREGQSLFTGVEHEGVIIWSPRGRKVIMVELTVLWKELSEVAAERKKMKFQQLVQDCWEIGWMTSLFTSRGGMLRIPAQIV